MSPAALQNAILKITPLTAEELSLLTNYFEKKELHKGDAVLKEGEMCRSLYFVEQGYLRTWYNKDGVPINLNFTFEDEFAVNVKSYRSRQPSEYTIEAGENAVVWIMSVPPVRNKISESPQFARFIRHVAIKQLLDSESHSDLFKIYTPAERYEYIEKHKPILLQRISLSMLASYLGVTRETLSRIRSKSAGRHIL